MADKTLYDITFEEAAAERERRVTSENLISRDQAHREVNEMGIMRWYLHPHMQDPEPSTKALYFHELEVPQGSNSGKLLCQGGVLHFVLEGSGYTEVEGRPHEWEAGDAIVIPILENGVTYQHFNTGVGQVRMLVSWANLDSAMSPEGGVAMEILEACPEYSG